MEIYNPAIGDKLKVSHPDGLYTDNVLGTAFTQNYEVLEIDPAETYGIKLMSKRGERIVYSNVEPNWFDTQLTGRQIKLLK
jgi:hypothetical protein